MATRHDDEPWMVVPFASKEGQIAAARASFVRDERDIDEAVAELEATVWAILTGGINRYYWPQRPAPDRLRRMRWGEA